MAALVGAQGFAMLLSFAYYLVAARTLAPDGFGVVRYSITLAQVAFGVLQVLSTGLGRELGAARGDDGRTGEIIGTSVMLAFALWVLSLAGSIAAFVLGVTGSADVVGLVVVLSGLTTFTIYWAIGRGLGATKRMAVTYVGGSLVQLLAFLLLVAVQAPSARTALVIFGLSSIIPVVACELISPIIRGSTINVSRRELSRLWMIGQPLLLAQICYMIWNASDQVWVDHRLGADGVGLYGAASNLSRLLLVLPLGVNGVLLPRIAELRQAGRDSDSRRLVAWAVIGLLVTSGCLAVGVAALREQLLEGLYGSSYKPAGAILLALATGMVVYTGFATLTTSAIGWGRPSVYLLGMAVAAAAQVILFFGVSSHSASSTAWIHAASIGAGMAATVAWLKLRPFESNSDVTPHA